MGLCWRHTKGTEHQHQTNYRAQPWTLPPRLVTTALWPDSIGYDFHFERKMWQEAATRSRRQQRLISLTCFLWRKIHILLSRRQASDWGGRASNLQHSFRILSLIHIPFHFCTVPNRNQCSIHISHAKPFRPVRKASNDVARITLMREESGNRLSSTSGVISYFLPAIGSCDFSSQEATLPFLSYKAYSWYE